MVRVEGSRKVVKRLLVDDGEGDTDQGPGNKILLTSNQPRSNNRQDLLPKNLFVIDLYQIRSLLEIFTSAKYGLLKKQITYF